MGKASRIKQQSAREKIVAQRAAAQKAERRQRLLITGGSILLVLVIVGAFIGIKLAKDNTSSSSSGSSSVAGTLLPASVASQVTTVPAATLDKVGKGSAAVSPTLVTSGSGATLTSAGKPQMLYIGAEFCPYCAAMRWSMAVALSRFGKLTALHGIHSSSTDTDPNTATLTFYKSGYDSNYLNFTPVENETVSHAPLQNPTTAQNAIWAKYEPDPSTRGYPFIDFGNKVVLKGPIYNPAVLAGKSWSQIAAALKDPSSPIAQNVDGAANYLTSYICKMTNNQPSDVCSSAAVTSVQGAA